MMCRLNPSLLGLGLLCMSLWLLRGRGLTATPIAVATVTITAITVATATITATALAVAAATSSACACMTSRTAPSIGANVAVRLPVHLVFTRCVQALFLIRIMKLRLHLIVRTGPRIAVIGQYWSDGKRQQNQP